MCRAIVEIFTLAELLRDPLARMVMRSDGVSEEDHSALLFRVRDTLLNPTMCTDGVTHEHQIALRFPGSNR